MSFDPKKVISIALNEVGYLEKETNANLDSKTGNAGDKNYTKYARDLDALNFYNGRKQHVAWCDVFVDWCFVMAYGMAAALALTCQPTNPKNNCGAGCKYSRDYYKKKGRLFDTPQAGDQIFFYSKDKTQISHTGLVEKVTSSYVYTVEGNTSSASGVVANGGAVAKKKYKLTYARLAGFGRPDWDMDFEGESTTIPETPEVPAVPEVPETPTEYKLGERTLKNVSPYMQGADVIDLQTRLNALGYDCGKVDGKFGSNTEKGVKSFQKAAGIEVDGKFGKDSFKALVTMESKPEQETTPEQESTVTHTVKQGDTLWGISRKYLGKGNRYPEIMEENGLKSTVIRPGMVLKIPA